MLFLFAPGAGAPSSSPWMQAFATRLGALGRVVTLDYPYMKEGRGRPDPLPQLIAAHRQALHAARRDTEPVTLIGKSMGGRVGCHVALEESVHRVVCLGYPLVAAHGGKVRDQVLLELATPILFVQGTRDPLCPLEHLEEVRSKMKTQSVLHVVDGGDHSLLLLKRQLKSEGRTQADVDAQVIDIIKAFVA